MQDRNIGYFFIVMASIIVIVAGLKSAAVIVVPFLLSVFIAIILAPLFNYINTKGVPSGLSLVIVITLFLVLLMLVAKLIGSSVQEFSSNIELYESQLSKMFHATSEKLANMGIELPVDQIDSIINTKQIMLFSKGLAQSVGSMFTNSFVVLLSVVFMLLESSHFLTKISDVTNNQSIIDNIEKILEKIKRYMFLKALISFFTAVIIWIALVAIGTDYAFLWAVLAFLLNFIPNIGSIIAAVPPVLLTLVQLGYGSALMVVAVYLAANIIIGSIIEPRIMGKGLGLSTLVVFLSLIFWGWVFGIVGMLLSIPLTMIIKIILDANENTRWMAILLGTCDTDKQR
ncbi:MAG: AI-2E family transporter [Campylobacterota bacterium]|nr:AI-2E family transporter [Campylobacterota bacterium]